MSIGQFAELALRLEHRHSDGTWSALERSHHDPAEHDPERGWATGQVYQCTTCDERVRVRGAGEGPVEGAARDE